MFEIESINSVSINLRWHLNEVDRVRVRVCVCVVHGIQYDISLPKRSVYEIMPRAVQEKTAEQTCFCYNFSSRCYYFVRFYCVGL